MPHDHTRHGDQSQSADIGTGLDAPEKVDPAAEPSPGRGRLAALWNAVTAAVGAVMGLLPHLLHHISFLAGAALVTGVGGNLLFGALGLLLSVPLLRRLYRRFKTWKAPAVAVAVFTVMFSLSAFVIGPAISDTDPPPVPGPTEPVDPGHGEHHD
jgi:hypothetical protein